MAHGRGFAVDPSWRVLLKDVGVQPANVLRRAALPADLFNRADHWVNTTELFRLWEAIEAEASDPRLPLRIAQALRAETFSPVCFAALCSPNMRVASERVSQHKRLVGPMALHVKSDERGLSLTVEWLEATATPPHSLAESEAAFFVELIRRGTREPVNPIAVTLLQEPELADDYERYFGVRVTTGDLLSVVFSPGDAERPFLTAHDGMWSMFEPHLKQRLDELDAEAGTSERVRSTLLELLPSGQASMDQVAERLAMSKRTLQRRLQEENASFQTLLNQTREELARHYLLKTGLPCTEISFLLGYDDPNSFFRAFHEWTGDTPEGLRRSGTL